MVVDAAEKQLPLLDRIYKEYSAGAAPPVLEELAQLYHRADGFVVVAGEYNHGIQPRLSNLLDLLGRRVRWSLCGYGSTHDFGGTRHAERPLAFAGAARARGFRPGWVPHDPA